MAIRCDICGRLSPDRSVQCECGYHFHTGAFDDTVALQRAYEHKQLARREIGRGVALVLLAPIISVLGMAVCALFDSFVPLVIAGLLVVLLGIGGMGSIAIGVARRLNAGRELRAAEERRQLPPARVLT